MKRQQREEVSLTVYLKIEQAHGETSPDIRQFFTTLLQHPYISHSLVWGTPTWKDILPPWSELEESPFEEGDTMIRACKMDHIWRTLLCRRDEDAFHYLPFADEEFIERAAYEHIKRTYPYTLHGFYPCPQSLQETYQTFIQQKEEQGFLVRWVHTGKFEATYHVKAESQEEADAYVAEHRLELEPASIFPLSDDYQQFL